MTKIPPQSKKERALCNEMMTLFGQIIDMVLQLFFKNIILHKQNTLITQKYQVQLLNQHLSLYITSTDHSSDWITTLNLVFFLIYNNVFCYKHNSFTTTFLIPSGKLCKCIEAWIWETMWKIHFFLFCLRHKTKSNVKE